MSILDALTLAGLLITAITLGVTIPRNTKVIRDLRNGGGNHVSSQDFGVIKGKVEGIDANVAKVSRDIEKLEGKITSGFGEVTSEIGQMKTNCAQVSTGLTLRVTQLEKETKRKK